MSPKIVIALLFLVVALELAALQLYMQVDSIVNVDLYNYGLQFTSGWITNYWISYRIALSCLLVAPVVMALSLIPYHFYSKENTRASRWSCILFPLISACFLAVSMYFIMQIDNIVNITLYDYGLQLGQDWITKYLFVTRSTLTLTETSAIIPFIMAIVTWKITKE